MKNTPHRITALQLAALTAGSFVLFLSLCIVMGILAQEGQEQDWYFVFQAMAFLFSMISGVLTFFVPIFLVAGYLDHDL